MTFISLFFFRCIVNCDSPVSTSSRINLRTDCGSTSCPPLLIYRWSMFRYNRSNPNSPWTAQTNFASFLATKETSKNLVMKKQMLQPRSLYRITVDVLSPDGAFGWSSYSFETSAAPSGGACHLTQLDREAVGRWLNISCHGWKDQAMPLTYEFYREVEYGQFDLMSYSVQPYSVLQISPSIGIGVARFKVAIINVVGSASEIHLLIEVGRLIYGRCRIQTKSVICGTHKVIYVEKYRS